MIQRREGKIVDILHIVMHSTNESLSAEFGVAHYSSLLGLRHPLDPLGSHTWFT